MLTFKISAAAVTAILLLAMALQDAFEVMLLPRRIERKLRLMRLIFRGGWVLWSRLGRQIGDGSAREHFLSLFGALSMLMLFGTWVACLILGYGLLIWAIDAAVTGTEGTSLVVALHISGGTFFTVGAGPLLPHSETARLMSVAIAGSGLGFIAVVIGYLPVLYQLFARREAHIIQMDARAGSPPSAVTLITRHVEAGSVQGIDALLHSWETWAAELLESHLSYPMLAYYRSQHDNQSWLAAMAAIMDTCSLVLVGLADLNRLQARMTFSIARQVVVEMALAFHISPTRYDGGDRLDHAQYEEMERIFAAAGVGWSCAVDCEQMLGALRATYEPLLDGLAAYLLLPLPPILPDDEALDNWERGPRGIIARRLIEDLAERGSDPIAEHDADAPLWRRVRTRLK